MSFGAAVCGRTETQYRATTPRTAQFVLPHCHQRMGHQGNGVLYVISVWHIELNYFVLI
jgi:hypothetical protein